jgi:hypothetical protein
MKNNGRLILFTLILVVLATACKFFFGPDLDWSGFSPIFAIALFAGFIIRQKDMSFLLPLLALFISDAVIQLLYTQGLFPYAGFYDGQVKNYAILLSATLIGWALKGRNTGSLLAGAIAAPTVFFLLSNLGVWMGTTEVTYTKDFSGLMTCYAAALPFYKNALIATLVFLPGILLAYNYMTRNRAALTIA